MPNRNIAPRITRLSTPSLLPYQCLMVCPVTETMYYKKSATGAEKQERI